MNKYFEISDYVSSYNKGVKMVSVEKETDNSVWVNGIRSNKISRWSEFIKSPECAIARIEERIKQKEEEIVRWKNAINIIKSAVEQEPVTQKVVTE